MIKELRIVSQSIYGLSWKATPATPFLNTRRTSMVEINHFVAFVTDTVCSLCLALFYGNGYIVLCTYYS
jgi:hypothetical protein